MKNLEIPGKTGRVGRYEDFMKLDITKTNIKYNNYSGLPFEIQFLKAIKEGHSCLRLLNPLTH